MCDLRKNIRKTLKMSKITVGLTLSMIFVPNQVKNVSLWDLLLLGSLKCVLRGRYVLLRSLKSMMSMYTDVM